MQPEMIPRFRIDGKYYKQEDLSEKEIKKILEKRVEDAMAVLHYEKKKLL